MMNNDILEYKGYHTKVTFDSRTCSVRGKIEGINDLIDFETNDLNQIETEFHSAVDDYLEFCAQVGKSPEREYKGTFNVRIDPDLHKELATFAAKNDVSLNAVVSQAIEHYLHDFQTQKSLQEVVEKLNDTITAEAVFKASDITPVQNRSTYMPRLGPNIININSFERKVNVQ